MSETKTLERSVCVETLKEYFETFDPESSIFSEVVLLDGLRMNRAYVEDGFVILAHEPDKKLGTSGNTLYRYLSLVLERTDGSNRNFPVFMDIPRFSEDEMIVKVSVDQGTVILTSLPESRG